MDFEFHCYASRPMFNNFFLFRASFIQKRIRELVAVYWETGGDIDVAFPRSYAQPIHQLRVGQSLVLHNCYKTSGETYASP